MKIEFDELSPPLEPAVLERLAATTGKPRAFRVVATRYIARVYHFGGPISLGDFSYSDHCQARGEPLAGIAADGLRKLP